MTQLRALFYVALLPWICVACSSKSASTAGNSQASDSASAQSQAAAPPVVLPVHANSTPQEVVLAFLNGMRDGNSGVTGGLLTKRAQDETVKHNWPVQPPGAPGATYQLGDASYLDPQQTAVQVPCVWSETDGRGGGIRFEVIWTLRRQNDGWRLAGFASEVVPGQPPYYFNFEDINNLKAAQAEAEAAIARLMQQQSPPSHVAESDQQQKALR